MKALELTHYEPLTLSGMEALAEQAIRLSLDGVLAWHRVGVMRPNASSSWPQRPATGDAFDAAMFVMDHLKSAAWFWKRSSADRGGRRMALGGAARRDHADLARWK